MVRSGMPNMQKIETYFSLFTLIYCVLHCVILQKQVTVVEQFGQQSVFINQCL